MTSITDDIRASATEVLHGHEACKERAKSLLSEMGLPNGLLPLDEFEEFGYVKYTGFVWAKQKKETTHKFEQVNNLVSYDTEVTGFWEKFKIKKLTGVKSKEMLLWMTLKEIVVDDSTKKVTFYTASGIYKSFPKSAYEV